MEEDRVAHVKGSKQPPPDVLVDNKHDHLQHNQDQQLEHAHLQDGEQLLHDAQCLKHRSNFSDDHTEGDEDSGGGKLSVEEGVEVDLHNIKDCDNADKAKGTLMTRLAS